MKPRLLDLFCKAGGAGKGYADAGFEVVGVDIEPQPNYPFEFVQADALKVLEAIVWTVEHDREPMNGLIGSFEAVHASPPCQASSALKSLWPGREHPELIPETYELLERTGLPYVIENVPGSILRGHPQLDGTWGVELCGSMFGLEANGRQLRRHRLFESNFPIPALACNHVGQPVGVYGHGGGGDMTRGYKGSKAEYEEAMGIDWATKAEIAQAIPPAFTRHIGAALLQHVIPQQKAAA